MIRPTLQHYDLVLVNTPAQDYGVCIEQDQSGTIPPLGLGSILTFLAHHGKKVGLLDADALKMSVVETIDFLRSCQTDYVGFTAMSENIHIAGYIAQALPQRTILGGIHARLIPEETIQQFSFFYAVVHGEGEESTLKIIDGTPREEITSVAFVDGEKYVVNPKGEWIDVNAIPPIDKIFFEPTGETYYMITSRGCPFNCSYCASPLLCGRVVRFESMTRVVAQMKIAYDDGKRFFHFLDDQFLISEKRAREFFEGLKSVDLYGIITWRAMARVDVLLGMSEETLHALKESGGTTIAIGIESGCDRILKMTHKGSDNNMAKVVVKKLVDLGFIVKAFFILGFPTETYREIQETRNFIMELGKLGLSYFNVAILRPYPGTGFITNFWVRDIAQRRFFMKISETI